MEIRYATISKTGRRHNNEDAFKAIDISVTWKDGSKHQRAYRNGLLAYIQEVSKYGTVLKKEAYSFLPDNKVKVTYETIDYKNKTLKTLSTSVMEVPDMEMYHEDMNVDSGDYRWENYYNK